MVTWTMNEDVFLHKNVDFNFPASHVYYGGCCGTHPHLQKTFMVREHSLDFMGVNIILLEILMIFEFPLGFSTGFPPINRWP